MLYHLSYVSRPACKSANPCRDPPLLEPLRFEAAILDLTLPLPDVRTQEGERWISIFLR